MYGLILMHLYLTSTNMPYSSTTPVKRYFDKCKVKYSVNIRLVDY